MVPGTLSALPDVLQAAAAAELNELRADMASVMTEFAHATPLEDFGYAAFGYAALERPLTGIHIPSI